MARSSGCQVVEAPWLLDLAQNSTRQETKKRKMRVLGGAIREDEAGAQGRRRDPRWANPPGADRDLGSGRGRQRGERTVTVNGGRCRHAAQRQVAEAGGWQVRAMYRWAALCAGRGIGYQVQHNVRGIRR